MAKNTQEVVYEGWLTKSPPTKRIWRARWRRRWFSLTHSGEIPNQFILTYYADRNCRKQKGSINLDDCEQVDLGLKLDERKLKFDHVFDIKTPTRTYYLAAETENEMKAWVNYICKVCGLKSCDEEDSPEERNTDIVYCEEEKDAIQTPPISPVSTNPYIPISECVTGKTPIYSSQDLKNFIDQHIKNNKLESTHTNQTYGVSQKNYLNYVNDIHDPRFYDKPRMHHQHQENEKNNKNNNSPLQSPTDSESVFTDDDMTDVNVVVERKYTKIKNQETNEVIAPPRPPKLGQYMNLNVTQKEIPEEVRKGLIITDDMYDFPRSHHTEMDTLRSTISRRHYYNNATPMNIDGQIFRYDISPKPSTSQVFSYEPEDVADEPASPLSQSSSTTAYSNLPSPLLTDGQLMPPPVVNRELKPKRKLSDSLSISSNPEPSSPRAAPNVDRKLKPSTPLQEVRKLNEEEPIRMRAAPSPTPLGRSHESLLSQSNQEEQIYHHLPAKMQYLDLDLDCGPTNLVSSTGAVSTKPSGNNTVYKKVDFEKTEAFNLTRNNLEKERQEPVVFFKK